MDINQNQAQINQIIEEAKRAAALVAAGQPMPQFSPQAMGMSAMDVQTAAALAAASKSITSQQIGSQVASPQVASPQAAQPTGPRSFDQVEIQELNAIRQAYEEITLSLGQLEMQRREVSKNEKKIDEKLMSIEAQEKVFLDKIMVKYGEGTFDIATGVFTPKS